MFRLRRLFLLVSLVLVGSAAIPSEAADYHYFRMIGGGSHGTAVGPATPPPAGTLNYVLRASSQSLVGKAYSGMAEVAGAAGAVTFSVQSGVLPTGVSLNPSTGGVSGVTTTAGTFSAVLKAQDAAGAVGMTTLNVSVSGSLYVSAAPADIATVGIGYAAMFAGVGGQPPYVFSTTSVLPPGLTLEPTGLLSGVPTGSGGYSNLFVQVRDAAGRFASSSQFSIRVADPLAVTWAPSSGTVNTPYSPALPVVSGGQSPFAFSLNGVLPDGLVLDNATGALVGIPSAEGTFQAGLTVVDVDGRSAQTGLRAITIGSVTDPLPPGSPLTLTGLPSLRAQIGIDYLSHVRADGGAGPYLVSLAAGTLPPGLSLAADGTLSGVPNAIGTYSGLVFKVTDATSVSVQSVPVSISVSAPPALLITGEPGATAQIGSPYTATFTGMEGSGRGYTFSVLAGSLPPGLMLSDAIGTSGVISGTPDKVGSYSGIRIRVTDSDGNTADTAPFTISVLPLPGPGLAVEGHPSSIATVGEAYAGGYSVSGGSGTGYAFSVVSGVMPSWMSLDALTGALSGTPSAPGSATFTIGAVDGQGVSGTASALTVTTYAPPAFTSAALPFAIAGHAYEVTPPVAGGHQPFAFSVAGVLPDGLLFDPATGTVSGVPSVGGAVEYPLTFKVVDADGRTATLPTTLTVYDLVALTFLPPNGAKDEPYIAQPTVSGGVGPYSFAVTNSSGGAYDFSSYGLAFDPETGRISGVPSVSGTVPPFSITVTDALGLTAVRDDLRISFAGALAIAGTPPGTAVSGSLYTAAFTATGGTGSNVFSIASGTLPAWLTLDAATGALSGTPAVEDAGTIGPFSVMVANLAGASDVSSEFSIQVIGGTAAAVPARDSYRSGQTVSAALSTSLPSPVWTFKQTPASPSLGLSASGSTMIGTMPALSEPQTFTIVATATYGAAAVDTAPFTVTGNPVVTISGGLTGTNVWIIGSAYSSPAPTVANVIGTPSFALLKNDVSYTTLSSNCPGLSFSAATGVLSGTPSAACSQSGLKIRVTDSFDDANATTSAAFTLNAVVGVVSMGNPSPSPIHSGQPFSGTLSTSLDAPTWTFRVPTVASPDISASDNTSTATYSGIAPNVVTASSLTLYARATSGPASVESSGVAFLVRPPLAINNFYDLVTNVGNPVTFGPVAVSNAIGTVQYGLLRDGTAFDLGSECPGVVFSGGKLSGTPTAACYVTGLQIQAVDSADPIPSPVRTALFSLSVATPLSVAAPAAANQGHAYSHQLVGSGGRPPYTYALAGGSLPVGIALDGATGMLSSAFVTGATTTANIRITDADGRNSAPVYSFTVYPATASASLTAGTVRQGASFGGTLESSLSNPSWSFTASPSSPSLGITANGTTFSGAAPTVASRTSFGITAMATQSSLAVNAGVVTLTVAPAFSMSGPFGTIYGNVGTTLTSAALNYGGSNVASAPTLTLLQGGSPVTIGALCAGLSFSGTTGQITGAPTATCNVSDLSIRAVDTDGATASTMTFNVMVGPQQTAPTGALAGSGIMGVAYSSGPLTINGGVAPYTWAIASGSLPPGLALDPNSGVVSGTPTWATTYTFALKVTDASGKASPNSVTQTIVTTRTPGLSGTLQATGQVGTFYSSGPLSVGTGGPGTPPYTYALNGSATLPPGLSLDSQTGVVSGIPTMAVNYTNLGTNAPALVLVDANGVISSYVTYNPMTISAATAAATVQSQVRAGGTISGTLATSLTDPTWSFAFNSTPAGQPFPTLTASGTTFSGAAPVVIAPTTYGIYATASNVATSKAAIGVSLIVKPDPSISGGPIGVTGNAWTPITASPAPSVANAIGTVTFSLRRLGGAYSVLGIDCPGLAFNASTGQISGTPTAACDVTDLSIRATDSYDGHFAETTTFSVSMTAVLSLGGAYPNATSASYSASVSIFNGTAPYSASVLSGSLPPGLSLSVVGSTVVLSGNPGGNANTYPFTLKVTDDAGATATLAQSVSVVVNPLQLSGTLPAVVRGLPYSYALTDITTGGMGSYSYSVISGSLPTGLALDANGLISGTPAAGAATTTATIKVVDTGLRTASTSFTFNVSNPPAPTEALITSVNVASGSVVCAGSCPGRTVQTSTTTVTDGTATRLNNAVNNTLTITYNTQVAANSVSFGWFSVSNYVGSPSFTIVVESSTDGNTWIARSSPTTFKYTPATGSQYNYVIVPVSGFVGATARYWRLRTTSMQATLDVGLFRLQ